jgi:hypothetical protein
MYGAKTMTNNNRERVIRIEKGQTLYVVCPPLQPFRVFFDSKLNDLAIAECEPQDVPAIEENAPAVPASMATEVIDRVIERADENVRMLQNTRPFKDETITIPAPDAYYGSDPQVDAAIEQGLLKTVFPDRFNKPTEQRHVEAVTETLGPIAGLYKHEKQVLGATVTAYTHDPASPFSGQAAADNKPKPHTPECVERSKGKLEFVCTCGASPVKPQADLFGEPQPDRIDSDIPFFNEQP